MLLTGLTRDGLYLIEQGKIQSPLKNLRFNESPVEMLKNTIALSKIERALGNEMEDFHIAVPGLKVSAFRSSSSSQAI